MRARAFAIGLALSAVAALALPGGAAAKPGYFKVPGQYSEVIQMRTSGGYRFVLEVFGRRATVNFDKRVGHDGSQFITYSLRRRLARGPDIHFRLGRHGRVDLRFVVDKRQVRKTGCAGGPSVTEFGHFVGTLRIRGRHGEGAVDLHRTSGVVAREPPLTCRRVKPKRGTTSIGLSATKGEPRVPKGALELIAGARGGVRFEALRLEEPKFLEAPPYEDFDASISRREGDLTVTSIASTGGSRRSFVSPLPSKPLSAATISPTAPFSGEASFAMTSPRHGEWSGDLAVYLAGYGQVPLTGPKFAAGLCETKACTPTLPESLRPRTSGRFKVSYLNGGESAS